MVHTVIEVMRMDKKFIAAVAVCFVALVGVATGTYFLGQKSDENIVKLGKANITETTAADKNIEAAGNVVEKETQKERYQFFDRWHPSCNYFRLRSISAPMACSGCFPPMAAISQCNTRLTRYMPSAWSLML